MHMIAERMGGVGVPEGWGVKDVVPQLSLSEAAALVVAAGWVLDRLADHDDPQLVIDHDALIEGRDVLLGSLQDLRWPTSPQTPLPFTSAEQ